jgi:CheY-like chemotaxis protein
MMTDTVKQRRILYVEDDPTLRLSTVDLLDDMGHQVVEAADAPTALEWLRAGHPVDLLLTDIKMPLMNGQELVAAARALRPDLTVIFTTGASDRTVNEITRDSRTACLLKPFGIKDLETLLRTLD